MHSFFAQTKQALNVFKSLVDLDSNHLNLNTNTQIMPSKRTIEVCVDRENDLHTQSSLPFLTVVVTMLLWLWLYM